MWSFPLFPEEASTFAVQVDRVYFGLLLICGSIAAIIAIALVYFAIRYRKNSNADRSPRTVNPTKMETTLVVVLTFVGFGIFAWATEVYFEIKPPPGDALDINVVAKQWMWKTQQPDGQREINSLHLPVGRPVRLTLRSEGVIHSFYVPAFRIKQDVIPGHYTHLTFTPTKTGTFHLFCAEYCGAQHSKMVGQVVVMEEPEFQEWLEENQAAGGTGDQMVVEAMAGDQGGLFFQYKCYQCHMSDNNIRAPNLEGLFGREVAIVGGTTIKADEEYIRESIIFPAAKVVKGYPPVMPSFKGQIAPEDIDELIEYIKSLQFDSPEGEGESLVANQVEDATATPETGAERSEGPEKP
ncbi:MAG: cytochrome c oxidase subunit II [Candidatus Omnitrophica bacterium]|nr:cytochrome c oxidase subunit II [Candidatus Omnitrophota bacterium]